MLTFDQIEELDTAIADIAMVMRLTKEHILNLLASELLAEDYDKLLKFMLDEG